MARQESLIQLTGCVGNIIFYRSVDGYLARKKGGIAASRIKSEPAFARTRENNSEFSRAARATKTIRTAFGSLLLGTADTRMTGRLNGTMVNVIRADAVNPRGERNVMNGNLSLLQGFDFNKNSRLSATFLAPFTTAVDRPAGTLTIDVPAFIPARMILAPESATHFWLKAGGAAIDFGKQHYSMATSESAVLPLIDEPQGPIRLTLTVSHDSTNPILLVFGIGFRQARQEAKHSMADLAYNAMAIVKVDVAE